MLPEWVDGCRTCTCRRGSEREMIERLLCVCVCVRERGGREGGS